MIRSSGSSSDPNGTTRPGPVSSRWLSMIRFACGASSACTAMRSSLTASGNGVRDRSDDTIVAMPCVSSSPRTTSASICDGVRKMTTSSVIRGRRASDRNLVGGHERVVHFQENHRHVVMLVGGTDERFDFAHDALAQLPGVEVPVFLHDPAEARIAKQVTLEIHRLADAIGVEHDNVAGRKSDALFLEQL